MQDYKTRLARLLAASGCLFFADSLQLKDGRPTPYFVNLGNLRSGKSSWELGQCFADWLQTVFQEKADVLVGPSYKGSAIAQACALALYKDYNIDIAFEYDRKEAKTHGEASGGANMFVTGALFDNARVLVLDDVGTSMATKVEILDKLEKEALRRAIRLNVLGIVMAVDREQTQAVYDSDGQVKLGVKGQDAAREFKKRTGIEVFSLLGIKEMLKILRDQGELVNINGQWQPLGNKEMAVVEQYLETYGR